MSLADEQDTGNFWAYILKENKKGNRTESVRMLQLIFHELILFTKCPWLKSKKQEPVQSYAPRGLVYNTIRGGESTQPNYTSVLTSTRAIHLSHSSLVKFNYSKSSLFSFFSHQTQKPKQTIKDGTQRTETDQWTKSCPPSNEQLGSTVGQQPLHNITKPPS